VRPACGSLLPMLHVPVGEHPQSHDCFSCFSASAAAQLAVWAASAQAVV
jgi:hypothetical protein